MGILVAFLIFAVAVLALATGAVAVKFVLDNPWVIVLFAVLITALFIWDGYARRKMQ